MAKRAPRKGSRSRCGSRAIISNRSPRPIVCHILGLLPTRDAGRASVVSHTWKRLLASTPTLHLGCHCLDFGVNFRSTRQSLIRSLYIQVVGGAKRNAFPSHALTDFCVPPAFMLMLCVILGIVLGARHISSEHGWISALLQRSVRESELEVETEPS